MDWYAGICAAAAMSDGLVVESCGLNFSMELMFSGVRDDSSHTRSCSRRVAMGLLVRCLRFNFIKTARVVLARLRMRVGVGYSDHSQEERSLILTRFAVLARRRDGEDRED